jgi:hypothetical protein
VVLEGHIYVTRRVRDLDRLQTQANALALELSRSLLVLPPDVSVSVNIVRLNGHSNRRTPVIVMPLDMISTEDEEEVSSES